ncbi:MAG: hypothetical protein MI748_08480, partial [Opitutales bacterium]|nr:hypothetical protein [Opitutales bacterium]
NIVDGEQIVLRSGDSLLLMANDGDGTSLEDVDFNFYNDATGELVDSLVSTGGSPDESSKIQYVFEREIASLTVDTYRVEAVIGGTAHSMWVEVFDVDFGGAPSTVLGFQREWTPVSLPSEVVLETDSTISLVESIPEQDPRTFTLSVGGTGPQAIVARIDSDQDGIAEVGEPIVDITFAQAITQDLQRQSRMTVVAINPDGSMLVEAALHLDHVPTDLSIEMNIVRGGVSFDDSTITRTITAADFDAMGNYTYYMQMVGAVGGGLCHEITFSQGSTVIAQ